jgi:hypothetical protein
MLLVVSVFAGPLRGQIYETPFESESGRVFVNVRVNGEGPFRFMIDLGASGNGRIDERLAAQLALRSVGTARNSDGVNVATVAVVEVAELAFGPIVMDNLQLPSRDYNRSARSAPLMGILGQAFFSDHLLTIDYPNQRLLISEERLVPGDPHVVAYEGALRIPLTIGAVETTGGIDTGSSLVMHVPRRYASLVRTSRLEIVGEGRRANTTFELYRGTILEPITIAGSVHERVTVRFSDPVNEINIGSGFLSRFVVRVDQRQRLIELVPR